MGRKTITIRSAAPDIGDGQTFVRQRVHVTAGSSAGFTAALRNCSFIECVLARWAVRRLTLDGVKFHNCRTAGPLLFDQCVFRHVTFSGTAGEVMIDPLAGLAGSAARAELETAFRDVDWAIDITTCRANSFSVSSHFPMEKIRYNWCTAAIFDMRHYERFLPFAVVGHPARMARADVVIAHQHGSPRAFVVAPEETIRWLREHDMTA
ncbi:MAG: hypothetical protein V4850_01135 [Myxococcota bacterium]